MVDGFSIPVAQLHSEPRAPSRPCRGSAMESLDVKELVIYAEVRGRPDISGVVWMGTLNDGRCKKVNLLRIGTLNSLKITYLYKLLR